jgi:hypothetical protein
MLRKSLALVVAVILFTATCNPALASARAEERLDDLHMKVAASSERLSIAMEILHWKVWQSSERLEIAIERLHDKIENPEAYS